jgi:hypothetical protein
MGNYVKESGKERLQKNFEVERRGDYFLKMRNKSEA